MHAGLIALTDGNCFYVSCHRMFDPKLIGKPVVALSNGDGNVVSRSNEAKALGVKMGQPWFELREQVKRQGLIGLSSQYSLYGEVSNRILDVMRAFSPSIEPYSIDENFTSLCGMDKLWPNPTAMGRAIGETILRDVGIPTCTGIAPTKTLAKLMNAVSKKRPEYGGVLDFTALSDADATRLLDSLEVGETWGIGSRLEARLLEVGITTVNALRQAPLSWIRKQFGVVVERTVCELRGIACIDIEEVAPAKKQIVSSKTFGRTVTDFDELCESVATYTALAAAKLRAQQSAAELVQVFVQTNRFRHDHDQYANAITVPLTHPSSDTRLLTRAAIWGLRRIYRSGYLFKKTGVMLSGIAPAQHNQAGLFDDTAAVAKREKAESVMQALDAINQRFGRDTVKVAAAGTAPGWKTRADMLTPAYTTRWDQLPKALAR